MKKLKEKRRSKRSPCKCPVEIELISLGEKGLKPVKHEGVSFDISKEGIGILTDYPLKKDDVLKLYFPLTKYRASLPVFVRVVWARPVEKKFRVGMQFLH